MKQFTTAHRLAQIMSERGMRQADIIRAVEPFSKKYGVKLGKSILSQYLSGKTEPGQEKLTILGLALNVSEAWLMGFDVPRERTVSPNSKSLEEERIARIHELASLLPPEDLDNIISQMEWLVSRR